MHVEVGAPTVGAPTKPVSQVAVHVEPISIGSHLKPPLGGLLGLPAQTARRQTNHTSTLVDVISCSVRLVI